MTFAFVQTHKAFLPALEGYPRFFSRYNIHCEVVDKAGLEKLSRQVEWLFMGTDFRKKQDDICRIHEYISPSMPPLAGLKNLYKSWLNTRPDARIFKNEYVQSAFYFRDNIPFFFQDIGIDPAWLMPSPATKKLYDFIYIGELSERRNPSALLECFTRPELKDRSLLLLSRDYEKLAAEYAAYPNIIFRGPVKKEEVKHYILQAKFGINYIPDTAPFNELTSTKFLEYAACGIPIISTDYPWIRRFEKTYGGNYFYVDAQMKNFKWEEISNAVYTTPDLSSWTWDHQVRASGILQFLKKKFPELDFEE